MTPIFLLIQIIGMLTLSIITDCLLIPSKKKFRNIVLNLYILFCGVVLALPLGQYGTPLLLAGCFLILFLWKDSFLLWNLILFQVAWFWSVLTDYAVSIPMCLFGYDVSMIWSSITLAAIFLSLHTLLAIIPAFFLGKWLHLKLQEYDDIIPPKIQKLLLCEISICSCIFLLNIIAGSFTNYPSEILLFNGVLFFSFAFANLVIILLLYHTLQENKMLALKAQEQEKLAEYTSQLESHYQEIRRFKHDYMNILATMSGFIQENDMERLKDYFELHIAPTSRLLANKDAIIARLSNIRVLEIKGLLYTKLVQAMNLDLDIDLELSEEITAIGMNLLILSRVLGIYLDNAMEAALLTPERYLHIAIIKKDRQIIFHLENSTLPPPVSMAKLVSPGFSTKENHSGLGLSTAQKLLESVPNVRTFMTYEAGHMKQILTILNQEQTS